jgi:hypothetical protein
MKARDSNLKDEVLFADEFKYKRVLYGEKL